MALAIDASSPAIATQTSGTTATVTTASFTPPAGSILLVSWAANTQSGTDPAAPSITDNLGAHLTYGLAAWSHRADTPNADGQAATWTAAVASSAAMTVTVTNGASSGNRHAALKVYVITGADTADIDGATGKSGSTSTGSIAQNYTAQITGGWGFISAADWDVTGSMTAGTGCTRDGTGAPGSAVTYGFLRRTTADDVNGNSNTLNVTLGGTSGNVRWAYVEIRVASGGTDATATPAVLAATTALPRPDVNVVAGPAVLASVAALPRPNVNVVAGPAVLPAVTALPRPDVNVVAAPAAVSTVVALPQATPTVGGDATATPATVATVTALPRPDVNVAAGPVTVPVTVALPAAAANTTAGPAVLATTVALARPNVNTAAGPTAVTATTALPQVAVNVTVGATVIPTVVTLPTPGAGGSTTATPASITTTVTIPRPDVNVSAGPATIALTVTLPQVSLPGSRVKATSDDAVAAAVASVAAVSALRTSDPAVLAAATSAPTVG